MFAYCNNSPTIHNDSTGLRMVVVPNLSSGPPPLKYDVDLFDQGERSMCWAYCQTMIESFRQGWGDQKWVDRRAKWLGIEEYGIFYWNQEGWPTNRGASFEINNIGDVYYALKSNGPFYAYYANESGTKKHLVVVTGVDPLNDIVYTNNPWGKKGEQSFEQFLGGVAWEEPNKYGMTFRRSYYVR